jgi:hypothetical protein
MNRRCQLGKKPAKRQVEGLARRRKSQAPAGSLEKPEAKYFGQFGDPAADGAVGQREIIGGQSDRAEAGRSMKGAQVVQRWYL